MDFDENGEGNGWWSPAKSFVEDVSSKAADLIVKHPWRWRVTGQVDPTEKLEEKNNAVHRFYVKSCVFFTWLFLPMSFISLLLSVNAHDLHGVPFGGSTVGVFVNYIFMIMYSTIYTYYVVMHYYLRLNTPLWEFIGIVLCLVAWVCFLGLYGLLYHKIDSPQLYDAFYFIGDFTFTIGSVAFIVATIPKSYFSKEANYY